MVVGHRGVGEAVEGGKPVHVVPYFLIVGVKDVGTILMHVDAFHVPGIHVAGNLGPLVDDQDGFARFPGLLCKSGAIQSGADDEVVVFCHGGFLSFVIIKGQRKE